MKVGYKYTCDYTGDAVLEVVKLYGNNQFVVQIEGTDKRIMASGAQLGKPHLCLVHVSGTDLTRHEGKLHG